ncbi:PREDICTED: NF-kappa-B inhibitor-like protein 1 isoform X2 [Priapulus caudatus]|uniref:NF-kappa-B inhibitor-like protein 1 n=1 Tax=Priapulus caudatus TaxID=37621 RepID=A0ABM1ET57_PRICU|nr:PREDICTED: NF-kappa-B inhibitor-like protein 1 isoform X2 [Priapulus caudatus]
MTPTTTSSTTSSNYSKIKKYIKQDRLLKLRRRVLKKRLDLSHIRLKGDQTLLHLAAKSKSRYSLEYLLEEGLNPLHSDRDGNTALHLAAEAALSSSSPCQVYEAIVSPLVTAAPAALNYANCDGTIPKTLLCAFRRYDSEKEQPGVDTSPNIAHSDVGWTKARDNDAWTQKLAEELDDEFSGSWGRYNEDYPLEEDEPGTYDEWADNMRQRYASNQRKRFGDQYGDTRHQKQEKQRLAEEQKKEEQKRFQKKLEKDHEEYQKRVIKQRKEKELLVKKQSYNAICAKVFDESTTAIRLVDLPFRDEDDMRRLADILLCDVIGADDGKRYLRGQQRGLLKSKCLLSSYQPVITLSAIVSVSALCVTMLRVSPISAVGWRHSRAAGPS